jgi:hypothetical protein
MIFQTIENIEACVLYNNTEKYSYVPYFLMNYTNNEQFDI